jgi:hypothetical protein
MTWLLDHMPGSQHWRGFPRIWRVGAAGLGPPAVRNY